MLFFWNLWMEACKCEKGIVLAMEVLNSRPLLIQIAAQLPHEMHTLVMNGKHNQRLLLNFFVASSCVYKSNRISVPFNRKSQE